MERGIDGKVCPRSSSGEHKWVETPGNRRCLACGAVEHRGQSCFDGHRFYFSGNYQVCRVCGVSVDTRPKGIGN